MTLSLYNLPAMVFNALPFVGAGGAAALAYFLTGSLLQRLSRAEIARLEAFAGAGREAATGAAVSPVPMGSFQHRVRLAFKNLGIDAAGQEDHYLWLARSIVGAVMFAVLLLIGLPLITSLSGFLSGYVFVNGWVTRAWNETRTEIEAEIPSLLTRLGVALQIAPNVPGALEQVAKTLRRDGPLHKWTMETAARMHTQGHGVMGRIRDEAAELSTSLAIVAELIGRMWTTGGEGYHKAFAAASENLEAALDARVMARAKGSSAQKTVNTLMALIVVMIGFLTHNKAMGDIVRQPLIQLAYAGIVLMVVYGHGVVSDMIDNAV